MLMIMLVDDQPTVRQGLRMRLALEPDLEIVGEANNGAEALAMAPLLRPHVVVMDVEMPGIDGLQATRELRASQPHIAIVVLSIHDDANTRARALAAGAAAFVSKHAGEKALLAAIRQALHRPD